MNAVARVSRAMRGANAWIAMLCAWGAIECAGSALDDYTPRIAVVPGAAARSLWILSRNAEAGEGAEAGEEADALVEPQPEASADAPQSE